MPSYRDWIRKIDIDIDYYSAFIKAWIAFNSWYRSEYRERTDREIIEKLKTESNRFKGYIDVHADFLRLGIEQQGQCKAFYKEVRPYVVESVLRKDRDNNIIFINERSKVSRGVIEVLYLLRCSLMHGEVTPDNNSLEVYKYAYYVLAEVLKKMV